MTTKSVAPPVLVRAAAPDRRAPIRWLASIGALVQKEWWMMSRYPIELLAGFGQILVMIVIFTFATLSFTMPGSGARPQLGAIVAYGFIPFLFLTETLLTMSTNLRREQKQGTLEQLYLSPVSRVAPLMARALITMTWTTLLAGVSLGLLRLLVGTLPFANAPLAIGVLVMMVSGTFGVGFAFAAITLRIQESAQTLATLLQFGFMVLCAPFFPFHALPIWGQYIARLIPLAHGVDLFRSTLMGFPPGFPELAPLPVQLLIVTSFGVLMPMFGLWCYHKAEVAARQEGRLGDY